MRSYATDVRIDGRRAAGFARLTVGGGSRARGSKGTGHRYTVPGAWSRAAAVCAAAWLAACGSASGGDDRGPPDAATVRDAGPVDDAMSPTDASTTPDATVGDDGGTDPPLPPVGSGRLLARARIGPGGGAVHLPEFELFVPPGALERETDIEVRALQLPETARPAVVGVAYELLPDGLRFAIPAQARLIVPDAARGRIASLGAVLSFHGDRSRRQDVTSARGPSSLLAFVPHFSTLWIHDPTAPGGLAAVCCTPTDPSASPTSCILATSSGLSCDPTQCAVAPGLCGGGGPAATTPCPCAPASPAYTHADCLTCDPSKCIPDPNHCPPSNACDFCNDPTLTHNPVFASAHAMYAAGIASFDCAELAVLNTAPPSLSSASWCYVGGAAKWCAFQEALHAQGCTTSPTTIAPVCAPTGCCAPIQPGVHPPGTTCGQLPEAECEVYAGQGTVLPPICQWHDGAMCPALPQRPGCGVCELHVDVPGFAAAYQAAFNLYGGPSMTCFDVWTNAPPPPVMNGAMLLSSIHALGTWCGHAAAAHLACSGTLGCPPLPSPITPPTPMGTGPTPTTPVPTAVACGHCGDPTFLANPDFAAAYYGAQSSYAGLACDQLDALGVTAPMGGPGTAMYATTLARWCVLQQMRQANGCGGAGGGLPSACASSCCEPITPGVEPHPLTCGQLPSHAECVASAGAGVCAWAPTCPTI